MSHRKAHARLSAYLEGEIAGGERARLERHVEDCGECATELRELRETVALLRSLPDPEVPRDFAATVMAEIRAEEERPGFAAALRRRIAVWLDAPWSAPLAAAAMSLAVFVAVGDVDVSAVWNEPSIVQPEVLSADASESRPRIDARDELDRLISQTPPGTGQGGEGRVVPASTALPEGQVAASDLPPLSVCLGAPPVGPSALVSAEAKACARLDSWMVELARQDPVSFQNSTKRLSDAQQNLLFKRLKQFRVHSGLSPLRSDPELPIGSSDLPEAIGIEFLGDNPER